MQFVVSESMHSSRSAWTLLTETTDLAVLPSGSSSQSIFYYRPPQINRKTISGMTYILLDEKITLYHRSVFPTLLCRTGKLFSITHTSLTLMCYLTTVGDL